MIKHCLVFFVVLSACGSKLSKEALEGSWKVDDVDISDAEIPEIMKMGKQEMLSATYTFNSDQTMERINASFDEPQKAFWKLEGDEIAFFSTDTSTTSISRYTIDLFNGYQMKWIHDMDDAGEISITLKKEN